MIGGSDHRQGDEEAIQIPRDAVCYEGAAACNPVKRVYVPNMMNILYRYV